MGVFVSCLVLIQLKLETLVLILETRVFKLETRYSIQRNTRYLLYRPTGR